MSLSLQRPGSVIAALATIATVAYVLIRDDGTIAVAAQPQAVAWPGPSRAMTLDQALAYARVHQPVLRSALARVAAASADSRIPRAQWFPRVGATAQAFVDTTNNTTASYVNVSALDLPRIGGSEVTATGARAPSVSTLAGVGIGQEVFDFGRIAAQAAVADLSYETERHRANAEALRIDLLVRDAYYGVQGARAVLQAAEDAYQRAGVHRDMAAAEVKSGLHAPIDLTRAEADLTRFDVGRIRAGGSLRTSQAVFAAAVGVDDPLLDAAGLSAAISPRTCAGRRSSASHRQGSGAGGGPFARARRRRLPPSSIAVPTAIGLEAGTESNQPLALAVVGGLTSSTILSLFLVPGMFLLLAKQDQATQESEIPTGLTEAHP